MVGRGTSLSRCLHFLARLWAKLKGFFTHFVVVSSYLVANFSYFIAVLSRIFVAFSHLFAVAFRFIVVLTHLFACKRHFLGHFVFLNFLNALFLGFLRLSLIAIFAKTADFVILSVAKNPKNLRYALFMDTSLSFKFCGLPRKNSLTLFFTRNDRKMASFGVEFMNFYVNLGKNLRNSKNLQIF